MLHPRPAPANGNRGPARTRTVCNFFIYIMLASRRCKADGNGCFSYAPARQPRLLHSAGLGKNAGTIHQPTFEEIQLKITILLASLLAFPLATFAASNPDAAFFKHAAEGGISEVDAGRLAQDKGNSQQIKDFGAMMVKDHSAANEKLQSIAAAKDVSLPTSASVGQIATKAKLEVLSGDTFDKSYVKGQVKAHRETIALFRKEISSGQDAEARAFATATLPTVRAHLKAITAIATSMGITLK